LAEIQIVLPESLDETDRGAIERLAGRYGQNPRAKLQW
jgi:hypothetical protein